VSVVRDKEFKQLKMEDDEAPGGSGEVYLRRGKYRKHVSQFMRMRGITGEI
jgi:hypothetical protein